MSPVACASESPVNSCMQSQVVCVSPGTAGREVTETQVKPAIQNDAGRGEAGMVVVRSQLVKT